MKLLFNLKPHRVMSVKGAQTTHQRGGKERETPEQEKNNKIRNSVKLPYDSKAIQGMGVKGAHTTCQRGGKKK